MGIRVGHVVITALTIYVGLLKLTFGFFQKAHMGNPMAVIDTPGLAYSDGGAWPKMDNPSQQAKQILETLSEVQLKTQC